MPLGMGRAPGDQLTLTPEVNTRNRHREGIELHQENLGRE